VDLVAVLVKMAEEDLTIKLKPVTGDMFSVSFTKSGTILGLKEELCKAYGATPEQIRLIYKGLRSFFL
jgi:Ubiquitin family